MAFEMSNSNLLSKLLYKFGDIVAKSRISQYEFAQILYVSNEVFVVGEPSHNILRLHHQPLVAS
jgi:hypothetical protein